MSTSVLMKLFETSPTRYDLGIKIITLGRDAKVKKFIVERFITEDSYVLDIGTGTGTLAVLCAKKGAKVFAFDKSEKMLAVAKEKVKSAGVEDRVILENMSVVEMDRHLTDESFDIVVASLVFSELSEAERRYALREIFRVLKRNGLLIIEDETKPRSLFKRLLYYLIRVPLSFVTYIVSQSTTRSIEDIEKDLEKFGFNVIMKKLFLLDSLILLVAKKEGKKIG